MRCFGSKIRSTVGLPVIVAACALSSACTLKNSGSHLVSISFPPEASTPSSKLNQISPVVQEVRASHLSARNLPTGGTTSTSAPTPQSFSDFTCFAVNVTGSGIQADSRLNCGNSNDTIGIIAGFVAVAGGQIEIDVPAGPSRFVELVGVTSVVGCPDIQPLLDAQANNNQNNNNSNNSVGDGGDGGNGSNNNNNSGNAFNGIGNPYQLASTTIDIFDDVSVTMKASFDPSKRVFNDCGGNGGNGGGSGGGGPLGLSSLALPYAPTGNYFESYGVALGTTMVFSGQGGSPPYRYTLTPGMMLPTSSSNGSIDPNSGLYTPPTQASLADAPDHLTVTDSTGQTATASVYGVDPNVISAMNVTSMTPPGPYVAGSCVGVTVTTAGFGGTQPVAPGGGGLTYSLNFPFTSGLNYYSSLTNCLGSTGGVSTTSIVSSITATVYVRLTGATPPGGGGSMKACIGGNCNGNVPYPMTVTAGTPFAIDVMGLPTTDGFSPAASLGIVGACVPYAAGVVDSYNNPTYDSSMFTVSSIAANSGSGIYSDSGCTTSPISSFTMPSSPGIISNYVFYYLAPGSTGPGSISGSISPNPPFTTYSNITVVGLGVPTEYSFFYDSANAPASPGRCVLIDLNLVAMGNLTPVVGSANDYPSINTCNNGPCVQMYSDSICTTQIGQALTIAPPATGAQFFILLPTAGTSVTLSAQDGTGGLGLGPSAPFTINY